MCKWAANERGDRRILISNSRRYNTLKDRENFEIDKVFQLRGVAATYIADYDSETQ